MVPGVCEAINKQARGPRTCGVPLREKLIGVPEHR